jgi:ASC-1-like (ASCH) protein
MEFPVIEISEPFYGLILTGLKDVEGKKGSPTWATLRAGNMVIIKKTGGTDFDRFRARIVDIRRYPDLKEYLTQEGLRRTLPGARTVEEGEIIYKSFGWTDAEIGQYGILAIQIRVE